MRLLIALRLAACAALLVVVAACGDDSGSSEGSVPTAPSPSSVAPSTAAIDESGMVIDRRSTTDAERAQLGASGPPLQCENAAGLPWGEGSLFGDTPQGATADQALYGAIGDVNEYAHNIGWVAQSVNLFPTEGWTELTDGDSSTFVQPADEWRYLIEVGTNSDHQVWIPSMAFLCPPVAATMPDPAPCDAAFEAEFGVMPDVISRSDMLPADVSYPAQLTFPILECEGFVGQDEVSAISSSDGIIYLFRATYASPADSSPDDVTLVGTVPASR